MYLSLHVKLQVLYGWLVDEAHDEYPFNGDAMALQTIATNEKKLLDLIFSSSVFDYGSLQNEPK
jgi:hypothetical protein